MSRREDEQDEMLPSGAAPEARPEPEELAPPPDRAFAADLSDLPEDLTPEPEEKPIPPSTFLLEVSDLPPELVEQGLSAERALLELSENEERREREEAERRAREPVAVEVEPGASPPVIAREVEAANLDANRLIAELTAESELASLHVEDRPTRSPLRRPGLIALGLVVVVLLGVIAALFA